MNFEIANILRTLPELGYVSVSGDRLSYVPPLFNLVAARRTQQVLSYLQTYSSLRSFRGEYFLCLYDGWREYSVPCQAPVFVPWNEVNSDRYLGFGSRGEPRFVHRFSDGVFPVLPLPVLTFCRHRGDRSAWLIPDPEFLDDEFSHYTSQVMAHDVDWGEKDGSSLYWRGNRRATRALSELSPREYVTSREDYRIDARYAGDVPVAESLKHKFLLDVDGMVSAWSGLFWKLLSNSLPVKLESHWEQWYYRFIEDQKHLVVSNRDLLRTYEFLKENNARANAIAQEGKRLATRLNRAFAVEEYIIG